VTEAGDDDLGGETESDVSKEKDVPPGLMDRRLLLMEAAGLGIFRLSATPDPSLGFCRKPPFDFCGGYAERTPSSKLFRLCKPESGCPAESNWFFLSLNGATGTPAVEGRISREAVGDPYWDWGNAVPRRRECCGRDDCDGEGAFDHGETGRVPCASVSPARGKAFFGGLGLATYFEGVGGAVLGLGIGE
jgi:hypothetical protein